MPEYIRIEDIKVGMILSEPVQNNFGQTMIPKDFNLEEKHLKMLKLWNISGAMIKKSDDDKQVELSPELIKKVKESIELRMDWKINNSIETDLFSSVIKFLAENG